MNLYGGFNTLYRLFCFFKPFLMVGKGLKVSSACDWYGTFRICHVICTEDLASANGSSVLTDPGLSYVEAVTQRSLQQTHKTKYRHARTAA